MKKEKITVLDNINGEIHKQGISKDDFCSLLGVGMTTYTNWQLKGKLPSIKLLKCAKILNCSVDYLMRNVSA